MKAPIGTGNRNTHCAYPRTTESLRTPLTQRNEQTLSKESPPDSGRPGYDASRLVSRVFLIRDRAGLRRVPVAFQSGDDNRATAAGRKFFGTQFAGLAT